MPRANACLGRLLFGCVLAAVAWTMSPPRVALAQSPPAEQGVHVRVSDGVAKFERFYSLATASPISPDERWSLWQKDYGLAAVPPTPFGRTLARKQLDAAWDRYAALVPRLPALTQNAQALAVPTLGAVARLFGDDDPTLTVDLILFVGQFDNNAFAGPMVHDVPTVFLPVEMTDPDVALAHEFAHAVHKHVGHLSNGYASPIGEALLMEGIAMRAAQQVRPGHDEAAYTPATVYGSTWLKTCEGNAHSILKGIAPHLAAADADADGRFTYGTGTTGLNDELYCAGWVLVGDLIAHGHTFRQLVRIPEADMPTFVAAAIARD